MIEKKMMYRCAGHVHHSFKQAKDAAESYVHDALKQILIAKGVQAHDVFKVALAITENRKAIAALLDYPDTEEETSEV